MNQQQYEALKKPFDLKFINFRITSTNKDKSSGIAVAYLDSRAIQSRLDEVVGCENWQDSYEIITTGHSKEPTAYVCTISIFCKEREVWISKSNGAANTDIEPVKGGLSDAFKRAASMWGIGRYLYDFESIWVKLNDYRQIEKSEYPKLENKYRGLVQNILKDAAEKKKAVQAQTQTPVNSQPQYTGNAQVPVNMQPQPMENPQIPANPPAQPGNYAHAQVQKQAEAVPDNIFTIRDATIDAVKNHTVLILQDSSGGVIKGFYQGEARVARNQRLSGVKMIKKHSENIGDYYIVNNFQIAA